MTPRLLNLDAVPRWHGNGFIQLDLNARERLHVWSPATTPLPENNATVHNHVWDMRSMVLGGFVEHATYRLSPGHMGTHKIFTVDENNDFVDNGQIVYAFPTGLYTMAEGSVYTFRSGEYHETMTPPLGFGVSVIEKQPIGYQFRPHVLAPVGQTPYNAHGESKLTVEQMWDEIDKAMMRLSSSSLQYIERILS